MEYIIEHMKGVLILLQILAWTITFFAIIAYAVSSADELEGMDKYIKNNPIKTSLVIVSFVVSTLLSCVYLFIYYEN